MPIKQIQSWKTTDGQIFDIEEEAQKHEAKFKVEQKINVFFNQFSPATAIESGKDQITLFLETMAKEDELAKAVEEYCRVYRSYIHAVTAPPVEAIKAS